MPLKKRDKKLSEKNKGTVNFMKNSQPEGKKSYNKKGYKKDFKKRGDDDGEPDFKKSKFPKKEGQTRSPYQNKGNKNEEDLDEKTKSQLRRQKSKISDLKKKLMTNYGKLIMKKADIGMENKQDIVKESMEMINGKWEDLIYKHDGCRIVQQMIKHGSKDQKFRIIEAIKPYCLKMMESKYSNHLVQKAFYYSPK